MRLDTLLSSSFFDLFGGAGAGNPERGVVVGRNSVFRDVSAMVLRASTPGCVGVPSSGLGVAGFLFVVSRTAVIGETPSIAPSGIILMSGLPLAGLLSQVMFLVIFPAVPGSWVLVAVEIARTYPSSRLCFMNIDNVGFERNWIWEIEIARHAIGMRVSSREGPMISSTTL